MSKKLLKNIFRKGYSNLGENKVINDYLNKLEHKRIAVDIAANDGVHQSNTYHLYKMGYQGLAVECDNINFSKLANNYKGFSKVLLSKAYVYPDNVLSLLDAYEIPDDFGFLSFDIDGYDYFVLHEMLKKFRPTLICAEINEKIPTPIKFTVKYDRNYFWEANHFFGQSLSQLHLLCQEYDYDLLELHYNNAFLVPKERNKIFPSLTPEEAYQKGYKNKPDRKEKFSYNKDVDVLLAMQPEQAVEFIREYFKKYEGKYNLYI